MSELQVGDKVQTGVKSVTMSKLKIGQTSKKSVTISVETGMKSVKMSEVHIGDRVQTGMKSIAMCEL